MKVSKRAALAATLAAGAAAAVPALAASPSANTGSGTTHCVDMNGNTMDGTVTWSPTSIWPPNHKYHTITVAYTDTDNDGDTITVAAPNGSHDQVTNGVEDPGAGHTDLGTDFLPGSPGSATDPGTAYTYPQVRAERSGRDGARTYTITVTCSSSGSTDASDPAEMTGQMGTATITVTVPHDMRNQHNQ